MEPTLNPIPALPTELSNPNYFKLIYRLNRMTHDMHFEFKGNLHEAIAIGKKYCEASKVQFVHVERFFTDILREIENKTKVDVPIAERKEGITY